MDISYYYPYSPKAPRMSSIPIPYVVSNKPIALHKPHLHIEIKAVLPFPVKS